MASGADSYCHKFLIYGVDGGLHWLFTSHCALAITDCFLPINSEGRPVFDIYRVGQKTILFST